MWLKYIILFWIIFLTRNFCAVRNILSRACFSILTPIIFKISDVALGSYYLRLMKSHLYRNRAILNAYIGGVLQ